MKGFTPFTVTFDELIYFGADYTTVRTFQEEGFSSPKTQEVFVIAASLHAAAILAVQVWKRSKGVRLGMVYPLESDAVKAYENQPTLMCKRYFPYKVQINGLGFVTEVEHLKNKSLDRNKGGL